MTTTGLRPAWANTRTTHVTRVAITFDSGHSVVHDDVEITSDAHIVEVHLNEHDSAVDYGEAWPAGTIRQYSRATMRFVDITP